MEFALNVKNMFYTRNLPPTKGKLGDKEREPL